MSPTTSRFHQASSHHLATARALLRGDELALVDVVAHLRQAVNAYLRAYLVHGGYALDETRFPESLEQQFFSVASSALGRKVVTVLRKLNFLQHGSPYSKTEGEPWTEGSVRRELTECIREVRALLQHLVTRASPPPFRGEGGAGCEPGTWVVQEEYDWGTFTAREGVVLDWEATSAVVRFSARRVERVSLLTSLVQEGAAAALDFEDAREARRRWFDLLLFLDPDYGAPTAQPHRRTGLALLGAPRALYVCSCCGYPTRPLAYPDFAYLRLSSPPIEPACVLCGWEDRDGQDDPDADAVTGVNGRYSLRAARTNFATTLSCFDAEDVGPRADAHLDPELVALKREVVALFNGMRDESDASARLLEWRAAHERLGTIRGRLTQADPTASVPLGRAGRDASATATGS